jgi:hypothetical protein
MIIHSLASQKAEKMHNFCSGSVSREKFNAEDEEITEEWEQFAEEIILERKEVRDKTTFIIVFQRKVVLRRSH